MIFKRNIVGQPLHTSRRQERVSFAVGFALVAGAALATSASLLWTPGPGPELPQPKVNPPAHIEAIEARAGAVPELDESVAVYLPPEGAVLGLPLEKQPAEEAPAEAAVEQEIIAEGEDTSALWTGLPAFAEAAANALEVEMAEGQLWASVGATTPQAKPARDIWPWVWVPTLVAMPVLLAQSHDSSHGSSAAPGGTGSGSGDTGGEATPGSPLPDLEPIAPAPSFTDEPSEDTPPGTGGGTGGGSRGDQDATEGTDAPAAALRFAGDADESESAGLASFDGFVADEGSSSVARLRGVYGIPSVASPSAAAPIPEPSSILLLGAGLALVGLALRRAR